MYRHPALRPLSREHHFALRYAKRVTGLATCDGEALAGHWSDIRLRFARYWSESLAGHFQAEEEAVPWRVLGSELRSRLLEDHRRIAALFRHLMARASPDRRALRDLGERLGTHARWEEQSLFALVQARASEEALADMALRLAPAENALTDLGWLPPRLGGAGARPGPR